MTEYKVWPCARCGTLFPAEHLHIRMTRETESEVVTHRYYCLPCWTFLTENDTRWIAQRQESAARREVRGHAVPAFEGP